MTWHELFTALEHADPASEVVVVPQQYQWLEILPLNPGESGPIQLAPRSLDRGRGLVHPPGARHGALAAVKGLFQWGAVFDHPALERRVVDGDPAFFQELFHLAIAQGIRHIPSHAREDHLRWEMG